MSSKQLSKIVTITGPRASGKTRLANLLAVENYRKQTRRTVILLDEHTGRLEGEDLVSYGPNQQHRALEMAQQMRPVLVIVVREDEGEASATAKLARSYIGMYLEDDSSYKLRGRWDR